MSNEITEGVAEPSTQTTAPQSNMSAADFVNRRLGQLNEATQEETPIVEATDEVTISLYGHNFPGAAQTSVASAAITPSTEHAFVRARARQMSMKVQSTGVGYGWRVGYVRLDGRQDGRR